jgi:hypothetical protein
MNASREKPPLITKERSQEPKKREMTQKVAQKMPMPMTQDLTNL